jgi:hypothetical protein
MGAGGRPAHRYLERGACLLYEMIAGCLPFQGRMFTGRSSLFRNKTRRRFHYKWKVYQNGWKKSSRSA